MSRRSHDQKTKYRRFIRWEIATMGTRSKVTNTLGKDLENAEKGEDEGGGRRRNRMGLLKRTLVDYCENTSVHGFSYLPGPYPSAGNWCERVFWLAIIVTGFTCASVIINKAFVEWDDNPTLTTTTTFSKPVTKVQVIIIL